MLNDESGKLYPVFDRLTEENKKLILGKTEALVFAQKFMQREEAERKNKESSLRESTGA